MRLAFFMGIAVAGAAFFTALPLQAQTRYSCRSSNGVAYQSTQPCPAGANGPVLYGPVATPSRETPVARIGEAPPHVKYMTPRCASLNDAIRTAQARGLAYETMAKMQRDYGGECAESESEARAMLSQERGEKAQQQRDAKSAEKIQRERTALQAQQCDESKRILVTKRKRTDLNEGERNELQRFEDNYRARCT